MSQDTHTHGTPHSHDQHHDGPCRCQGRCPGCPRAKSEALDKPSKTK